MGLDPGTTLGAYEILAPLGAGGMGEVYRARDTRLDREVAIKVLPRPVTGDADALARFEREAKAVAALSHPNILAIHDFGRHDDTAYAVMELLEGETLRERLAAGALPPRKTAELGRQIARGLGAAHEKGVVHRDLKPENVFVTRDGRVKILDFGLARTSEKKADATETPTQTSLTSPGTVLGTVGYMSPEQARSEPAEPRSDIFSLGAILYEMLHGRRAFARDTQAETMTAILKEDPPDAPATGEVVPPAMERIVRRCLEKNPEERFHSAHDLAFALESAAGASTPSAVQVSAIGLPSWTRWNRAVAALGLLVAGALAGALILGRLQKPISAEPVRVRSLTFSGRDGSPTASPDGRTIAFVSDRDGQPRIWLKQLPGGSEAALTEGPDDRPRFSPDGSTILFVHMEGSSQSIYRASLVGGETRKLIADANEADWSPDGRRIAFTRTRMDEAGTRHDRLFVASSDGTGERELARVENFVLIGVRWSPDGSAIAVNRTRVINNVEGSILLVDAESGRVRTVASPQGVMGALAWSGTGREIVHAWSEDLLAGMSSTSSAIVARGVSTGEPRVLFWAENLFAGSGFGQTSLDILAPGVIVFDSLAFRQNLRQIVLGPRPSATSAPLLTRGNSRDRQPVYSPDGGTVLFSSNRAGNLDLWSLDATNGAVKRLTDDAARDWDPAFILGGEKILWSSDRGGNLEIWVADADGSGARQVTRDGADAENPTATPDGEWVVYASGNVEKLGIWKIRLDGSEATHLAEGPYFLPEISPDGRYVVFSTADTANLQNRMQVVEVATGKTVPFEIKIPIPVTLPGTGNMGRARWTPDGKAIVYLAVDAAGNPGLYLQEFRPGSDTAATRRPVAGFSPGFVPESFGISPEGTRMIVSTQEELFSLMIAEGAPGIEPPARSR